jgi:pimeloyl-[acyl-carrier protein] methyl ester esterase
MPLLHQQHFGHGKTIVLVHGWGMHSGVWQTFAESLADCYHVICVDLPGHGFSRTLNCFDLKSISTVLADEIQTSSCCWLGWSLGATVVIDLARRFPDRVQSLIILAGSPRFTRTSRNICPDKPSNMDWPGMDGNLFKHFSERFADDAEATINNFLGLQVQGMPTAKALIRKLKRSLESRPAANPTTLIQGLEILQEADLLIELSHLPMPIKVVLGGKDTLIPKSVGVKLQQLLPAIDLTIIDQAGHVPFLTHSDELKTSIANFLTDHDRRFAG